jgi:hypothetical protein
MEKNTVEIFEYEDSNEYTKRQVYPVVEKAPVVHEGVFKKVPTVREYIHYNAYYIGRDRKKYCPESVNVPTKYKIVTTSSKGKVNVQNIEAICVNHQLNYLLKS